MVDIDVTQEILTLSEGGVGALKELLKLSGIIGVGLYKAAKWGEKKAGEKKKTSAGIQNFKDFQKITEGQERVSQELKPPVDVALLNQSFKKFFIAGYLEEDGEHPRIHYEKEKMFEFGLALKEYSKALIEKEKLKEQYAEEKEGMTESQTENVRENNRTADELFFTDEEKNQQVPFMDSVLDEGKKDRINEAQLNNFQKDEMSASDVKKTVTPPEGLTGKDIRIGEDNKSLNQVLNKIRLTGNAAQDRANIVERIRSEIPEKDFLSLRNDKMICFQDNEDHFVVMNMEEYTLNVSDMKGVKEEYKVGTKDLMSYIAERKKNVQTDLDTTLPKDFPAGRKMFIQEMYEACIVRTDISKDDINAIRNFMTMMEDKKEVTWKDMLLWEIAKKGQFEYAMVKMDAEQIENIYAAKINGVPDAFIQHMIRYEFSADQIRGTVNMLLDRQDATIQDMDALAGNIEGKQEKIKEALIRGYTEVEGQKKMTFEEVKENVADGKLKFMALDEKGVGQVGEFSPEGKEPDHEDENGRWFEAYQNSSGDRIFVNEGKTEVKYEAKIDSEPLSPVEKNRLEKQGAAYQDSRGTKYYKDKGHLVNENGKSVKQLRAPYQAKDAARHEAADMAKKAERKADKGR